MNPGTDGEPLRTAPASGAADEIRASSNPGMTALPAGRPGDPTNSLLPRALLWRPSLIHLALAIVLIVALWLRVFGTTGHAFDWGNGQFIHPDENFIGSVISNLDYPSSPLDFFNTDSKWNPAVALGSGQPPVDGHPVHDKNGFNYGSLPLYLIKIFASFLSWLGSHFSLFSSWQFASVTLAGRVLSGIFDTITVFLVFLLGKRLAGERTGLFAATLACFAVLSTQLAHFSTVDSFLGTFATGTVLGSVALLQNGRSRDYVFASVWLGAALATKASAVPLIATVAVAVICRQIHERHITWTSVARFLSWELVERVCLVAIATFVAVFIFQPYCILDWPAFKDGVLAQNDLASGSSVVFYTIKWHATTPLLYPLSQLSNYSLGIPLAILAYAGLLYEGIRALTRWRHAGALVAFFTFTYFISAGLLYMKYLRYMEPIVPSLCVLAALLVAALVKNKVWLVSRLLRGAGMALGAVVLALTICYGVAYQHIYSQPLTRLQASEWIYQHIPAGTRIAQNNFDEWMPLNINGLNAAQYPCAGATALEVSCDPFPTYDDDSLAKVQTISAIMANAQYYIENSRRAIESFQDYGSKYPYMQRFYTLMLGSKVGVQNALGYTLVIRFVEHPRLGPWTDTEQGANQNFNEYEHPPVEIWRNTRHLSSFQLQAVLTDNGRIADPTLTTTATPPKSLLLSAKDMQTNQHAPTYADMFPANGLPMRLPVPVWWLMIELLGLLALPISMRLFSRLGDRGFVAAKTVAILLLAWFAWILPSLRLAEYSRAEIAICLIPLAAISLAWGVRLPDIPRILRANWKAIALAEGAFLAGFAFFVWLRAIYPDLWHNFDGGEKSMDMSFLNAIVRSRVLPPFDPWFSGGTLNYYYYGHFTVATLLKLAAITPAVAINLALPTFFALALGTCVSIAYTIVRRIPFALLAGAFGMLAGNLYGAQQLIMDLQAASPMQSQLHQVRSAGSTIPVAGGIIDAVSFTYSLLSGIVQGTVAAIAGLGQVVLGHASLPAYPFRSWAWDGSRAIDQHNAVNGRIITEFPYWTFLYGDPHAHLWDIPFALCIVAVALNLAFGATGKLASGWEERDAVNDVERSRPLMPGLPLIVWPLIGVLLGAIGPTNTWDFAAMFGILGLVIAGRSFWRGHGWLHTVWTLIWQIGVLAVFAFGCYLPFYRHFQSFYSHIGWTILRHASPITDFATHFGLPLYVLVAYLLYCGSRDTNLALWLRARLRGTLFTMYYWERRATLPRYFALVHRPVQRPPTWHPYSRRPLDARVIGAAGLALAIVAAALGNLPIAGLALLAAALLIAAGPLLTVVILGAGGVLVFLAIGYPVLSLLSGMAALTLLLLIDRRERQTPALMFFHLMLLMGLVVAAAAEIVYVIDFYDGDPINFRNNTVFKLYEDAWLLLNISAAVALARLLIPFLDRRALVTEVRGVPVVEPFGALAVPAENRYRRRLPAGGWAWLGCLLLLVVGAAVYPLRMTPERLDQRSTAWPALAAAHIGLTLDGMAFLKYAYPDDYAAIQWIEDHISGSPVMLTSRYGGYGNFSGRVGMFTGLPTLVDWGGEASQQRYNGQDAGQGRVYPMQITPREAVVDQIYSTTSPLEAIGILHQYDVSYVYVGVQERGDPFLATSPDDFHGYPAEGLAKFPLMALQHQLQLVYSHGTGQYAVQIYKVLP